MQHLLSLHHRLNLWQSLNHRQPMATSGWYVAAYVHVVAMKGLGASTPPGHPSKRCNGMALRRQRPELWRWLRGRPPIDQRQANMTAKALGEDTKRPVTDDATPR